jgi:hypothetical protein
MVNDPSITDWISSLSAGATALITGLGVYFGFQKFESWKKEQLTQDKRDVAAEILSVITDIELEMQMIRHRHVLAEISTIEKRHLKLHRLEPKFKTLMLLRQKSNSLLNDVHIDAAIENLLKARNKLIMSVECLMDQKNEPNGGNSTTEDDRKIAFGNFEESDEFGTQLIDLYRTIRDRLEPILRMDRL